MTVIIDASAFIYFLASDEQNIIVQQANAWNARLAVCQRVSEEIYGVLMNKPEFQQTGALRRWEHIRQKLLVLSDSPEKTPGLARAMADLDHSDLRANVSVKDRMMDKRDLGEFLSVSHALALARVGETVIVVVDDRYGRQLVSMAQQLLLTDGMDWKQIRRASTRQIVEISKPEWRREQLPVEQTIARMETIEKLPCWA